MLMQGANISSPLILVRQLRMKIYFFKDASVIIFVTGPLFSPSTLLILGLEDKES